MTAAYFPTPTMKWPIKDDKKFLRKRRTTRSGYRGK